MQAIAIVLLVVLAWLPGAILHRVFQVARGPWGSGVLAVEASLSLAFLSLVLLPIYISGAPVASATIAAGAGLAVLLAAGIRRIVREPESLLRDEDASTSELVCFALAVAVLLPATLRYSGANVDDWWDLSFVSGWISGGHFGFAQMALSPDPQTHASAVHPRFLWSVWLMLQALVASLSGEPAWKIQAGPLAGWTCVLVVSAQAALARALFGHRARARQLATATVAMSAAWIWGTDALPLFVRGYQDKLVAAFVLAPVLIAVVLDSSLREDEYEMEPTDRRPAALAVACVALATVSVHSLVYTMAMFVCAVAVLARLGVETPAWLRRNPAVAVALGAAALYPLAQALILSSTFGEQGISLATRDNPVVRAHLSLNRLVGDVGPGWIVHPGAAFGPVSLFVVVGLVMAWRRRRYDDSARMLLATTVVPALLLFVPGIAALAGKLWVPWMLYRLGWLVPVAPMLGYAAVFLVVEARRRERPIAAGIFVASIVLVAAATAGDRLRRDMHEHPAPPPGAPTAAALRVYEFLASQPGRSAVLAPPNFSELVPAISGKPVVAFSERGTLVFSTGERGAYERLRDRATFFARTTSLIERDRIAHHYGVRWAVLPRTLVSSSNERAWMVRFGPEAFAAARAADADSEARCAMGAPGCSGTWWSRTPASARAGLTGAWSIVLETRDYFVAELEPGRENALPRAEPPPEGDASSLPWLRPFALTAPEDMPGPAGILASAAGAPGAVVSYDVPPRFVQPAPLPIWLEGPSPWEDVPADVTITLDAGVACRFSAVAVVPHLPHERRDVLEIAADDRVVRAAAHHGAPILLGVDASTERSSIAVRVRSLIGSPVSLADVRLLGDRKTCAAGWPSVRIARTPQLEVSTADLLALAGRLPASGRPFVALASAALRDRGGDADIPLFEEATVREPALAEAWLDLGFADDRRAEALAASGDADNAKATRKAARAAFRAAVHADSHSAWAVGAAAWSDRRAGHPLAAIWKALGAASIDPLYGDSWTIIAYALSDLHLASLAEKSLALAQKDDPDRNWPVLARADIAIAIARRGSSGAHEAIESARAALRAWIRDHPFDQAARDKISELAEVDRKQPSDGEREEPHVGERPAE